MRMTGKTWIALAAAAIFVPLLGFQLRDLASELRAAPVASSSAGAPHEPRAPDLDASAPRAATYSNIYRYDYVGPDTCGRCHAKNYELWRAHPHSKMNRNATAATVVGDFSGTRLAYGEGHVVFSKGLGDLTMSIFKAGKFVRQLKVTRTVGSRFVQMYIGVQVEGPEPGDDPVYTREVKLPFSYWIARNEWFPETYDETPDVAEYDDKGRLDRYYAYYEKPKSEWQRVCIKCHNTYPYAARFEAAADKKLVGFPAADIALASVAQKRAPRGPMPDVDQSELVTLGISCESCHFGGREHALKGATISFVPRSQDLAFPKATDELIAGARQNGYVVNSICNQCHTAELPSTYPNGGGSWNSREAKDIAASSCASKILCTSCHNPHEAGPTRADVPDAKKHLDACVSCHEKYRTPESRAAHSKHGEGVTCLDCHMPRIVHGLAGMLRSHRISSPADASMMRGDWANACNLCHLDKSVKWTVEQLEAKWGKKVDVKPPSDPAGPRWLRHKEAIMRQVAVDAYARSPLGKAAFAELVPSLEDPAPPNRMFAVLALERVLGRPITPDEYTPWGSPSLRKQQASALAAKP